MTHYCPIIDPSLSDSFCRQKKLLSHYCPIFVFQDLQVWPGSTFFGFEFCRTRTCLGYEKTHSASGHFGGAPFSVRRSYENSHHLLTDNCSVLKIFLKLIQRTSCAICSSFFSNLLRRRSHSEPGESGLGAHTCSENCAGS